MDFLGSLAAAAAAENTVKTDVSLLRSHLALKMAVQALLWRRLALKNAVQVPLQSHLALLRASWRSKLAFKEAVRRDCLCCH